jgi:hypothetical protein
MTTRPKRRRAQLALNGSGVHELMGSRTVNSVNRSRPHWEAKHLGPITGFCSFVTACGASKSSIEIADHCDIMDVI